MQADQSPTLITLPFAANGQRHAIPESSQTGLSVGAASLSDGFPPATMQAKTQGGVPPDGLDVNGILFLVSAVARWMQAGGAFVYDPSFSTNTNLGGYPKGAVLLRADGQGFWLNTADDNATAPDATGSSAAGWVSLNADWNATGGPGRILNRPTLAKGATSGSYADLGGTPPASVNADWNAAFGLAQILNRPALAKVATSGSYADLSGAPAIPAAQVNADWLATGGPAEILNRPDLAKVATTGRYADLSGSPVLATPPQFDTSTVAATAAFVQRALGSFAGQVTLGKDAALEATDAGMAIQWAGPDGGTLTLAPTATLPLNAIAFLIYNHGLGGLNLVAQGGDFIRTGGPSAVPALVLQPGEFALCLARVNGEYDVLVTRQATRYTLPPATTTTLGGVMPGTGLTVASDGTLNAGATGTTIVNLTAAASVTLDLAPLSQGAPEILFNLPVAAGTTCALTIANPPASGTLAECVLVVHNAAGSAITWPSNLHWPQGIPPSLTGAVNRLDTFVFYTQDGGATYNAFVAGLNQ